MTFSITRSLVATSLVLGLSALTAAPVQAQGSTLTRAQVKMERDTFLSMVRWDPVTTGCSRTTCPCPPAC
jgi:hypothetical protein